MNNPNDFKGKTALITGGASGIGFEIARQLSIAGAHVCVLDASAEAAHEAASQLTGTSGSGVIVCSVADAAVKEAIRDYLEQHKQDRFHCVVNAAAISPKGPDGLKRPVWEIPDEEWCQVMQVNLNGVFRTISAVLPGMMAAGDGAIVNISSLAGRRYSSIAGAAYATSKAGVEALTRQFAGEVAARGVRINAISPGRIQTPMAQQAGEEFNEKIRLQTPLQRLGTAEDIAGAALYLLSDAARFITGETLVISGGRGL
jgi:3-oxoacyl-[acyl-carrier protein] reductase